MVEIFPATYRVYLYFASDIKIVEFRNGLEGRASQISAVQILLNSKDLIQPEGMMLHLFYLLVLFSLY